MDDRPGDPEATAPSEGQPSQTPPAPALTPAVILNPYEAPDAPAGSTLGFDIPCLRCRFNLRGLPIPGRCPECGLEAARSLDLSLLRFRTPKHLAQLGRGALMNFGAIVGLSVLSVLSFPFVIGAPFTSVSHEPVIFGAGYAALSVALLGLWAWGWRSLTLRPRDPAGARASLGAPRVLTRATAIALFLAGSLAAFAPTIAAMHQGFVDWIDWPHPLWSPETEERARSVIATAWIPILVGHLVVSLVFLRRLGLRIPDKRIARAPLTLGLGALLCAATWFSPYLPWQWGGPNAIESAMWFGCAAVPLYWLFCLASAHLFFSLERGLTRQRRISVAIHRAHAAAGSDAPPQPWPPPAPPPPPA